MARSSKPSHCESIITSILKNGLVWKWGMHGNAWTFPIFILRKGMIGTMNWMNCWDRHGHLFPKSSVLAPRNVWHYRPCHVGLRSVRRTWLPGGTRGTGTGPWSLPLINIKSPTKSRWNHVTCLGSIRFFRPYQGDGICIMSSPKPWLIKHRGYA